MKMKAAGSPESRRRRHAAGERRVRNSQASPARRRTCATSLSALAALTPPPTRHSPQRPRASNQHSKSQMGKNEVDSKGIPLKSSHP